METPSRPTPLYAPILRLGVSFVTAGRAAGPAGIWTLADGEIVAIEGHDVGAATLLVPSEQVLLLAADLPLPGRRQRLEALPFAIEDALAEPIEAVHVALGAEIAPRRYLAAAVRHDLMRAWTSQLEAAGLAHAALVPDALALPVPPGGCWSVDLTAGRAVVRADDATGFAIAEGQLHAAWAAAGRPGCVCYGGTLPQGMTFAEAAADAAPPAQRLLAPALNLRQGRYAAPRARIDRMWRRLGVAAAAGLLAHGAIAAADTFALRGIAAKREAETRALVTQAAPNLAIGEDLIAAASDLLPAGGSAPSPFFPLLARTSAALAPLGGQIGVRNLGWSAADGTLSLDLEAADLATLQRIAATLDAAGLNAEAGAAAAGENSAEGKIVIRGGGAS